MVKGKHSSERGSSSVEYGLTLGAVTLIAAAMFAHSSAGIKGIWNQLMLTALRSDAAQTARVQYYQCMEGAHGDSKICKTDNH
jgi:Flp pilus assembly pilin Flp